MNYLMRIIFSKSISNKKGSNNFDIYQEEIEVIYAYRGGGSVKDVKDLILDIVVKQGRKIDLVVIVAGGNDLDHRGAEAEAVCVAGRMKELAEELVTPPYPLVRFVTICQIVPRELTRRINIGEFNERAKDYNNLVRDWAENSSHVTFWSHPRINNSRTIMADGVHLNAKGNFFLYSSIKKSIAHTIGHIAAGEGCTCRAEDPNPTSRSRAKRVNRRDR